LFIVTGSPNYAVITTLSYTDILATIASIYIDSKRTSDSMIGATSQASEEIALNRQTVTETKHINYYSSLFARSGSIA